jgi:hypothetical protein
MAEISSVLKLLDEQDAATFRRLKAGIRKVFLQASQQVTGGDWKEEDDAALDAATQWLYSLALRSYAKPIPPRTPEEITGTIDENLARLEEVINAGTSGK